MNEKGQSLVEFAVSLVVILILLAGAVEVGMATFQFIQMRDAVQEGALYGSICQNPSAIEIRAREASSSPLDLWDESVEVDVSFVENGEAVNVQMTYPHKMFMPFLAGRIVVLRAQVTDTILGNQCP